MDPDGWSGGSGTRVPRPGPVVEGAYMLFGRPEKVSLSFSTDWATVEKLRVVFFEGVVMASGKEGTAPRVRG